MLYRAALTALTLATVLTAASPARAHHIGGKVVCDHDLDGQFDAGDTPLDGITVRVTSLDAMPGQQFTDTTDASGAYEVGLPARTDRYRVELIGLPAGFTIVIPPGGTFTVQIITGNSATDHKDDVDFLLQGCAPTTTTTSTSTSTTKKPTTTTSSSTTTTTKPTTTTTTTSTSTTTLPVVCTCPGVPFLVGRDVRINNDADVRASLGANGFGGRVRFGKNVVMADGTRVIGDTVQLGNASSVDQVLANTLLQGQFVTIRGGRGTPPLPLATPFCPIPPIACGGIDVEVKTGETLGPLAPGTYGRLHLLNAAAITLAPGSFTFCDIKMGRNATLTTQGVAVVDVERTVIIGTASRVGPDVGDTPVVMNVAGKKVRVSQSAVANVAFFAPFAHISFGRDSDLLGCFCTDRAKSDKHITLECREP